MLQPSASVISVEVRLFGHLVTMPSVHLPGEVFLGGGGLRAHSVHSGKILSLGWLENTSV